MPLDRTWYNTLVDDDGTNTVGTVWNKAAVDSLMDAADAATVVVPTTLTNHGVVIGQGAANVVATSAGTAGQVLTSNGAAADPTWQAAGGGGQVTLLKANSGTDSNAAATNVDTVAISGLTAKDVIVIDLVLTAVTQQTTVPVLYNSTDGVSVISLIGGGSMAAGVTRMCSVRIRQAQSAATAVKSLSVQFETTVAAGNATFTTAWTGSWTLALRHGGVTAGGTLQWTWTVWKHAGQ